MTMTELVESTDREEMIGSMTTDIVDQKELAEQLLEQAKEQNIELVPLPRDQSTRPHRARQSTLGDEMEARPQRVRDSVPRKNQLNQPSQIHR
jgi:hypothetical protein